MAQYGEGEVDENGIPIQGRSGEDREIDRIETQSLPQLKSLLLDLQRQLQLQKDNPIVKYGIGASTDAETQNQSMNPGYIGTNSKKQKAYHYEYF